jgi:hypothetical protein
MQVSYEYINSDVIALYQILKRFFIEYKGEFNLNAMNNCSIPGIAFKTWKQAQLPQINNEILDFSNSYDAFFREGYLGGIVDVYQPRIGKGYYYDVNSLYPTAMMKDMPVGEPIFESLTIEQFMNSDWFGYVRCTVRSPMDIQIGLLSVRFEGKLITPRPEGGEGTIYRNLFL